MSDPTTGPGDGALPWQAAAAAPWRSDCWKSTVTLCAALPLALLVSAVLPQGLDGLLVLTVVIAVWVATLRSAARLLLAAAAGARTARDRAGVDVPPGLAARLIGLWLLAMLPMAVAFSEVGGGWFARLAALGAVATLPLATIVLARRLSFFEALDPLNWRETAEEVGMPRYLRLTAALAGLGAVYGLLAFLPLPEGHWRVAVQSAYWVWATLAWFHLAGEALRRSGLRPSPEPRRKPSAGGIEVEFRRLLDHGGTPADHRRLTDALIMRADRSRLIEHGQVHVLALLDGFEQPREAVEVAATLLEHDAAFCLSGTREMARLVEASCRHGYPALTVALAGNFLAAFPRSFKRDEVRLLACEAAARSGPEDRRATTEWLNALIGASLAADRRVRLKRIVPVYHAEGLIRVVPNR